jgi:hypothetical protein
MRHLSGYLHRDECNGAYPTMACQNERGTGAWAMSPQMNVGMSEGQICTRRHRVEREDRRENGGVPESEETREKYEQSHRHVSTTFQISLVFHFKTLHHHTYTAAHTPSSLPIPLTKKPQVVEARGKTSWEHRNKGKTKGALFLCVCAGLVLPTASSSLRPLHLLILFLFLSPLLLFCSGCGRSPSRLCPCLSTFKHETDRSLSTACF